jgi:hypothetical protein
VQRRSPGSGLCGRYRVLAFEWPGEGVLWRAERQTVVRIERPALSDRVAESWASAAIPTIPMVAPPSSRLRHLAIRDRCG